MDTYTTDSSSSQCASPRGKERLEECKDLEVRTVKSYALDTLNLSFRKRILEVPSCDYPTIDKALRSLQLNAGGYVIKLLPETRHEITGRLCYTVDDLIIQGDCDKFAGKCYVSRCAWRPSRPRPVEPYPVCQYLRSKRTGIGWSYHITWHGSTITVEGLDHEGRHDCKLDPCFDSIGGCRPVVLFGPKGDMVRTEAKGEGNSIIVGALPPYPDPIPSNLEGDFLPYIHRCGAYGFYFPPNVVLTTSVGDLSMAVTNSLRIEGCVLAMKELYQFSATNGAVMLGGCVIDGSLAFVRGNVECVDSNVWINGTCYLGAITAQFFHQYMIGANAHLTVDAGVVAWYYGNFISNIHGCDATNGGTLTLLGSEFSNNCIAVTSQFGSTVAVPDCRFCCNYYCLFATYNSNITSQPIQVPGYDLTRVFQAPWFINNVILVVVSMQSFIIIPNLQQRHNLLVGVIDGRMHTTFESVALDMIGQRGSCFQYLPSPTTPSGLGCRTSASIPGNYIPLPTFRLLEADAWAVVSGAFVEALVGRDGQSVKAIQTIEALGEQISAGVITHIPQCWDASAVIDRTDAMIPY